MRSNDSMASPTTETSTATARPMQLARAQLLLLNTAIYAGISGITLWLGYWLRFEFQITSEYYPGFLFSLAYVIPVQLFCLWMLGQLSGHLAYVSLSDIIKLGITTVAGGATMSMFWAIGGVQLAPPRSVIIIYVFVTLVGYCGVRVVLRLGREDKLFRFRRRRGTARNVIIIGAGDVGSGLIRELKRKSSADYNILGLFDDDRRKWNTTLHQIRIYGRIEELPNSLFLRDVDEAIIAMPTAPVPRIREIVRLLASLSIRSRTVPSYEQLLTGKVEVSAIRSIEPQDLLQRTPVQLSTDSIHALLSGKTVMVTGAGGSIGSELCRQIAMLKPRSLLVIERCETLMFQIEQELLRAGHRNTFVPVIADITDRSRMARVFQTDRPQVVFHAAAHKHVPLMEAQPGEAFRNNSNGTRIIADLASQHEVDRFVLISTDKAIRPTSVMGATKRLAELYVQSLQQSPGNKSKFMAVRFGNVLGSSGSVIPTFRQQIADGGPVTVTHPEVTRYFMTVQEAVGLVLQSAAIGQGGEIFLLDMGKPIRIQDLAKQMIELSGLRPDIDIEIKFSGLRPGEKLFEELRYEREHVEPTSHGKIMRVTSDSILHADLVIAMGRLLESSWEASAANLKRQINDLVTEYTPFTEAPVDNPDFPRAIVPNACSPSLKL